MRSNQAKSLKWLSMLLLLVLHSRSGLSDQAAGTGSTSSAAAGSVKSGAVASSTTTLGDTAASETISNPSSVLKLISEYAQDYTPADMSNPLVSKISNWIGKIQGNSNNKNNEGLPEPTAQESISAWDYAHPAIANIPSFLPFAVAEEKYAEEYTFWDWVKSEGVHLGIILVLFGAVPILLGLVPYAFVASHFWIIFNKFYSLNETIIGLLGAGHEHHHHHQDVGWGWEEGVGGWNPGWRQLGQQ